jgi:hypothetical protein
MPVVRLFAILVTVLIALGCQDGQSKLEPFRSWEDEGFCVATEQTENAANADFETGLTVPETSDSFNNTCNATLPALFQQQGDRIQAIARNLPGTKDGIVLEVPMAGFPLTAHWTFGNNGNVSGSSGGFSWAQTNVASPRVILFPVPIPPKATIKAFSARLRGNVGAGTLHAGLPGTMPVLSLVRSPSDGSAFVTVDSVTDTSASAAVYDAAHTLSKTIASPHAVQATQAYYLRLAGEGGANAAADHLGVFGLTVTYGFDP